MSDAEDTFDIIFVGSGAGGLIGAWTAAVRGLRTLVVEKANVVGGTTAYSGAGIWFPGSAPIRRATESDASPEQARIYLRSVIADPFRESRQDAYLDAGIRVIDELEGDEHFGLFRYGSVPDYFSTAPGATPTGNTIFPAAIPAEELGEYASLIRPPIPVERWGSEPETVFSGGRALIGRALKAFLSTGNGTLVTSAAMEGLLTSHGRVTGVTVLSGDNRKTYSAKLGVVLATGGFEHSSELRGRYQSSHLHIGWSNGADTNTGDALRAGIALGAATDLLDEAWFVPGVVQPDGRPLFHTGTRGGIWINKSGHRFVNELEPYDQAGHVLYRQLVSSAGEDSPAYWILDERQVVRDNLSGVPGEPLSPTWLASGALSRCDSMEEIAVATGAPIAALKHTLERFNSFANAGIDEDFHRGESPWDQLALHAVGYPWNPQMNYPNPLHNASPNPLVSALHPPYFVARVVPSDIGTKGGLVTDDDARVLHEDGTAITGLYAVGNAAAAFSGRVYPGAGTPIGSSIAFAYRAVLDMAGSAPVD